DAIPVLRLGLYFLESCIVRVLLLDVLADCESLFDIHSLGYVVDVLKLEHSAFEFGSYAEIRQFVSLIEKRSLFDRGDSGAVLLIDLCRYCIGILGLFELLLDFAGDCYSLAVALSIALFLEQIFLQLRKSRNFDVGHFQDVKLVTLFDRLLSDVSLLYSEGVADRIIGAALVLLVYPPDVAAVRLGPGVVTVLSCKLREVFGRLALGSLSALYQILRLGSYCFFARAIVCRLGLALACLGWLSRRHIEDDLAHPHLIDVVFRLE